MLEFVLLIFWLGIFNLMKLVWTDLDSLTIDARPSWLMSGVVLACFYLSGLVFEMLVIAFVFLIGLGWIKKRASFLGLADGDVTILAWVVPAMFLVGYVYLIVFLIGYVLSLFVISRKLHKNSGIPATIPITIGFCIVWATYTLFPMLIL